MEKITYNKNDRPKNQIRLQKSKRINCQLSEPLLIKCENFIASKHLNRDYTYSSLSDLIRKSLISYQEKKLNLTIPRATGQPKKATGIILPAELWEYYRTLPNRHRTDILESCLINYLNTI
jgi:hypothetical protein